MVALKKWIWFLCCVGILGQVGVASAEELVRQMSLRYAKGFKVEYFDTYKVVTVMMPWPGAEESYQYVLVPKGAEIPDGFADDQKIEIPLKRLITTSTTHLPHLALLEEVESLVGIDGIQYVNSPSVNALFQTGKLAEVGHGASIDLEKSLALETDLVMTTAMAAGQNNAHPVLHQAGVPVVINGAYAEPSLLGRTEWLKFVAAFYNKEDLAKARFDSIVARYQAYADRTKDLHQNRRPTVFGGALWRGTWYVSGGKTYVAQLIKDAGGTYLWADDDSRQSLSLDFEVVYEKAHHADCWLTKRNEWHALADVVSADDRYGDFAAFQSGQVYNANARLSENGGNDYWESGLVEPDVVLADLIKIFHPELLPNHQLKFYKRLGQ
jgi:iron complex transport system substrate-binding protein